MNPNESEKIKALDEAHLARILARQCAEIEACWDDEPRRLEKIKLLRRRLEQLDRFPHLQKLAAHLVPEMTRDMFWNVLVPLERAGGRSRISDPDMQLLSDDLADPLADTMPLHIILDNLRSALNTGAIFRSAECFGAEKIFCCGYTATPGNPKTAQAAMGTEKLVKWEKARSALECVRGLKKEGIKVYALETVDGAQELDSFVPDFPCALVLGNERFGIDAGLLKECDAVIRIPVYGRKNSLNVSNAFAVAAFRFRHAFETRS